VFLGFEKNSGQTAAFAAGFSRARGEVIITMDGDMQNDPRDIPKLLEKSGSMTWFAAGEKSAMIT